MNKLYVARWKQEYSGKNYDEIVARGFSEEELDDSVSEWIDDRLPEGFDKSSSLYDIIFNEYLHQLIFDTYELDDEYQKELSTPRL